MGYMKTLQTLVNTLSELCFVQCCLNHLAASPPEANSTVARGPRETELQVCWSSARQKKDQLHQ